MADNEQALCEALIRLLEEDFEAERSDVTYPETDQSGPPVEMRLRLGEPFPQAIESGKWFQELPEEIEAGLDGVMPQPGTHRLVFPIHPTEGKPRRTHAVCVSVSCDGSARPASAARRMPRAARPKPSPAWPSRRTNNRDRGIPLSLSLVVH